MVHHIVLWNLKTELSEQEKKEAAAGYVGSVTEGRSCMDYEA